MTIPNIRNLDPGTSSVMKEKITFKFKSDIMFKAFPNIKDVASTKYL